MAKVPSATQINQEARKTNENPTDGQKDYGNYKKGSFKWNGLDIRIENPKGAVRSGTDGNGKKWKTTMRHHYGYITRTNGYDGDPVDIFMGPNPSSDTIYIVNQKDPGSGKFDEHKCMCGFRTKESAKKGYLANYERGWKGLDSVEAVSVDDFKEWARKKGKKNGPQAGEYKEAAITLDIEIGDIVLTGRYKNKRREVKSIGTDELGQPTINKQKLLALRIEKKLPKHKQSRETQEMNKNAFLKGYIHARPQAGIS